jgi:hypothetical protein
MATPQKRKQRQLGSKGASTPVRVQPSRRCKVSHTTEIQAERTQPDVTPTSAVESSSRVDAAKLGVKGVPQRRAGRKLIAREPGSSISANTSSLASSEKTARMPQRVVKTTSFGEGKSSRIGSHSRKRAPMSPAAKPADKRGRKLLSSGDDSSGLQGSAKESDVDIREPMSSVSPSKDKHSERSERSSDAPIDKPLGISLPLLDMPESRPLPVPKGILDAPQYNRFEPTASTEEHSKMPVPVDNIGISYSAPAASGSTTVTQMATFRPEFVFQDPDSKPPPPIPEGHKLVHIVRHCRAWHKY